MYLNLNEKKLVEQEKRLIIVNKNNIPAAFAAFAVAISP